MAKHLRVNQDIKSPKVLLVDETGIVGEMTTEEAIQRAQAQKMDLVEVSPLASPPVCKIMDYGTHLYTVKKREKKQKSAQKHVETKTLRLSIRTGAHDLEVKAKQAKKFLGDRHPVKIVIIFKGREMAHGDLANVKMDEFFAHVQEVATIEQQPKRQGFQMTMILNPIK